MTVPTEHRLKWLLSRTVIWMRLLDRMGVVIGRGEGKLVRGLLVLLGKHGRAIAGKTGGRLAGGGGGRRMQCGHFPRYRSFKI